MAEKLSLREIVQSGFELWEDTIRVNLGNSVDYSLKIEEGDYKEEFPEEVKYTIGGDPVIGELILNALKAIFGARNIMQIARGEFEREIPAGQIPSIEVHLGIDNQNYVVSISDNGPGIAPENQKNPLVYHTLKGVVCLLGF